MANKDVSSSFLLSNYSSDMCLLVGGVPFTLDRELVASRSAKVAALLKKEPEECVADLLRDIPADPETFEEVLRFCHGFELNLTTENVMPLIILAYHLEMTDAHSKNNLMEKAISFFKQKVLPSWNETIKALNALCNSNKQAANLRLLEACIESLVENALADPCLLGEPIRNLAIDDSSEDEEEYRPNARKRLFDQDWKLEDLSSLPIQLYELIIQAMNRRGVPAEFVAASVCQYARKWVYSNGTEADSLCIYKKKSQQEVIEAVQRLLPHKEGLVPCKFLFEMLRSLIFLECSDECRCGFEFRIGNQLDQATMQDLLIPSKGYAKELQYDIDCVRRIMKHFYRNYKKTDTSGLIKVADLIEDFLVEVASDIDVKPATLASVADMSMATLEGTHKNSDGVYKAIDIYLDKHRYLTKTEKEDLCRVLDCKTMSLEACEHAAKNERLPVRFALQVLFTAQMQLRNAVTKEVQVFDDKMRSVSVEEDEENEEKIGFEEDLILTEMEKMSIKVVELEKECLLMRKEIESERNNNKRKKRKANMWSQLAKKLGCGSSTFDSNCQVKKKKKVQPKH